MQSETDTKKREQETESRNERIDQIKQEARESEKLNVAPEKPVRNSILKAKVALVEPEVDQAVSDDDSDQFATIKRFFFRHILGVLVLNMLITDHRKIHLWGRNKRKQKRISWNKRCKCWSRTLWMSTFMGLGKGATRLGLCTTIRLVITAFL